MRYVRPLFIPVLIFCAAFAVYWGTAVWADYLITPSAAYFDQLADAFLHGRLYLANPPETYDLTLRDGVWYVPFPPLPALLMLPWVALRGIAHTNTILFSIVMAAASVTLVYLILRSAAARGWTRLSVGSNLWLTALFAFGTVHWYMAIAGSVWFVAQICAVTFVALALLLAIGKARPLWAGLALGAAMLARPTVALTWPLLLAIAAQGSIEESGRIAWRRLAGWAAQSAVPMLLAVVGLLAYNAARFGSPLDFGYLDANIGAELAPGLRTYGQFSLHFFRHNFWVMTRALPYWDAQCGRLAPSVEGMSLLLTTPALVYVVRAIPRTPLVAGAWVSWGLLLIPLLTYYNSGAWQFGYRFSLDFIMPVMLLLAVAAGGRVSWKMRTLVLISIAVNAIGTAWWFGKWCPLP